MHWVYNLGRIAYPVGSPYYLGDYCCSERVDRAVGWGWRGGVHYGTLLLGKVLTTHLMQVAPNSKQSHPHLHKYEFSTYAKSKLLVATQHSVFFFLFWVAISWCSQVASIPRPTRTDFASLTTLFQGLLLKTVANRHKCGDPPPNKKTICCPF